MSEFIVKRSRAKMPGSCYNGSSYHRTAVLEVNDGVEEVSMISERARGVIRVVKVWGPSYCGGEKSAGAQDMREAEDLADQLNDE